MNRKAPLTVSLLLVFILFFSGKAPQQGPYNILWISCEDLSPLLPFYGDSTIATPHLSALASESIIFDNAFATAPVCAPSRSAIITGMYQNSIGSHHMRAEYEVVPPPYVKCFSEELRKAGYFCSNNKKTDYQFTSLAAWDISGAKAHWRLRKQGQPFFAVHNYIITHESEIWERKNSPLWVNPAKVKVPPYFTDTPEVRQEIARTYNNILILDSLVGALLGQLKEDNLLDNTIIFFWSDHGNGWPRYKRSIYDTGIKVPMMVRLPTKNQARGRYKIPVSLLDLGPTTLSMAGVSVPSHMQGKSFWQDGQIKSNRTYCHAASDRFGDKYDMCRSVRSQKFQYIKNFQPEKPYVLQLKYNENLALMKDLLVADSLGTLNSNQRLWLRKTKEEEELYDTEKDPWELNNLAKDKNHELVLNEMRAELTHWMREINDLGFIPEKELINKMHPAGTPYVTADPFIHREGKLIAITCPTEGASVLYKRKGLDNNWNLYAGPVNHSGSIEAIAHRIGYKPSKVVTH